MMITSVRKLRFHLYLWYVDHEERMVITYDTAYTNSVNYDLAFNFDLDSFLRKC